MFILFEFISLKFSGLIAIENCNLFNLDCNLMCNLFLSNKLATWQLKQNATNAVKGAVKTQKKPYISVRLEFKVVPHGLEPWRVVY